MVDFHTHTHLSDGDPDQSPDALCEQAAEAGIRHLSITDHDHMLSSHQLNALAKKHNIDLVSGCEFSCIWEHDNEKTIIHLGGHWLNEKDDAIRQILEHNQSLDYESYIREMLRRYKKHHAHPAIQNIDEACEKIKQAHPHSKHLGKRAVVQFLLAENCVSSRQEAYNSFAYGGEAHVSSTEILDYAPFEEAVEAITKHSLCTLNHLFYYHLSTNDNFKLAKRFKELGGHALECIYPNYSVYQHHTLIQLCSKYGLLANCGSDRHDTSRDFIFAPEMLYEQLKNRQLMQYGTLNT